MSKAEEFLKNKGFTRQVHTTNGVSYDTLCKWLSEYAEQESREAYDRGFEEGKRTEKIWTELKDAELDEPFNQQEEKPWQDTDGLGK